MPLSARADHAHSHDMQNARVPQCYTIMRGSALFQSARATQASKAARTGRWGVAEASRDPPARLPRLRAAVAACLLLRTYETLALLTGTLLHYDLGGSGRT